MLQSRFPTRKAACTPCETARHERFRPCHHRPHRQRQNRTFPAHCRRSPLRNHQPGQRVGVSGHGHRHGKAQRCGAGCRAAPPHRHHHADGKLQRGGFCRRLRAAGRRNPRARQAAADCGRHHDVLPRAHARAERIARSRCRHPCRTATAEAAARPAQPLRTTATRRPGNRRPPAARRQPAHRTRAGSVPAHRQTAVAAYPR